LHQLVVCAIRKAIDLEDSANKVEKVISASQRSSGKELILEVAEDPSYCSSTYQHESEKEDSYKRFCIS